MATPKDTIARAVDRLADELDALSRKIHDLIGIAPTGMAIHTRDFADAAVQPLARAGMVAAAKIMAMTALDLLAEPTRVAAAKAEFARSR